MTISTPALNRRTSRGVLAEVFHRQPVLAGLGLVYLVLLTPTLAAACLDPRTLDDAEVWIKPAKFLLSLSAYCFTTAWFFGCVDEVFRPGRTARTIVWIITLTSLFEMSYIALQASRGERSHFNVADGTHAILYGLMGIAAGLLVGASALLAALIARRPKPDLRPAYRDAVVLGLLMTFALGGGLGGYMSSQMHHWAGAKPNGPGLPFFGWSTTGGDLRPAHFFGIHAEQALPLIAFYAPERATASRIAVWIGAAAYAALTLWVFARALGGHPFP